MSIPHPIPYQGSKRQLAPIIARYFPKDVRCLIEPFAGSAAVSLYASYHQFSQHFILNDINQPLIQLWEAIVQSPETLADRYEKLWYAQLGRERTFYDAVRTRFNRTHHPYYFLYLLARCVKASVRYNSQGEFNQSPDNRRKGRHPHTMRQDILGASALLQTDITLTSMDYRETLNQATPDDLVYMDPPYQGVRDTSDPRYFQSIDTNDFVEVLTHLNTRHIPYIVSYDGRTGTKSFGQQLPESLGLHHIEIDAGRSSQATLLGRTDKTYESLYLSPALCEKLGDRVHDSDSPRIEQLSLL